jgi:hypothetical protein
MASVAQPVPQQPLGENQVAPIMGPTLTYRSITEKLSDVVLSGHIPTSWFVALAIALMGIGSLTISAVVLLVVDRNRPCWNPDLRCSPLIKSTMANLD